MFRKNRYGTSTANRCFYCGKDAIRKTEAGVPVCSECKISHPMSKEDSYNCPLHKSPMDIKSGKYGTYFFCWSCNRNWSLNQLSKFHRT